jgi:hypothetical protein
MNNKNYCNTRSEHYIKFECENTLQLQITLLNNTKVTL